MKQKITLYVLLLLVWGSVAAEPIKKPDNTTAAHPSISPKPVETAPTGPANRLFGAVTSPAPLAARAIGSYTRGCLAGGISLPINGLDWQMMRVSRNRNWGHPRLLSFLERFATDARALDAGRDCLSATCRSRAADRCSLVMRAIRSGLTLTFGSPQCLIEFSRHKSART